MEKEIKKLEQTKSEKGASLLEYALLAALIAVVCILAITFVGEQASTALRGVGDGIQAGIENGDEG